MKKNGYFANCEIVQFLAVSVKLVKQKMEDNLKLGHRGCVRLRLRFAFAFCEAGLVRDHSTFSHFETS
jgi:hypothetical protein